MNRMKKIAHINYEGSLHCTCTHLESNHSIETDAPKDNNGLGQAFSPTDLLATSLASCMITVMGIEAKKNDWSFVCRAEVFKEMKSAPRRVGKIKVNLFIERPAGDEVKNRLEEVALHCPVALSLSDQLEQEVNFSYV